MEEESLKFSIVIPLYNKCKEIEETLNSIKAQTYQNFEVIIVNDGSTDGSERSVERWFRSNVASQIQYRLISQKNSGVSVARNYGIQQAENEYIAFLDADDIWKKDHLLALKRLIKDFSDKVVLFSTGNLQLQDKKVIKPKLGKYEVFTGIVDFFKVSLISNGFIHPSSACIKKSGINGDLFPENMKNYEDVITWARLSANKGFAFCSARSAVYVIDNAESSMNVDFNSYIQFEKILDSIEYDNKMAYKVKFYLLHLLFCRLNLPLKDYIRSGKIFLLQYKVLSFLFLMVILVPRFLLRFLRNIRKK